MADGSAFVIDASIAVSWCFEDEMSPVADAALQKLRHQGAVAPAHWPLEIANALRSAERRGRIDERAVPVATALLTSLPIRVDDTIGLDAALGRVLSAARSLGLTAYDAAYLDLAARRGVPLATADEQLTRAAIAAGVELVEAS